MSIGLSRGSQKRGFQNSSEPYYSVSNDEKEFWKHVKK